MIALNSVYKFICTQLPNIHLLAVFTKINKYFFGFFWNHLNDKMVTKALILSCVFISNVFASSTLGKEECGQYQLFLSYSIKLLIF